MAEIVTEIPFSQSSLEDFCGLWSIPPECTEQEPEIAYHVLNALWAVPIIPGPQSARRPSLLAIGRVVQENFTHSYSRPFHYNVGTIMGRMQAWPQLYEFEIKLFSMSEAELLETYDRIKRFVDTHAGIARKAVTIGAAGAIVRKSPAEIVRSIASRTVAGGDAVVEAGGKRASQVSRVAGNVATRAGTALTTRLGAALSVIGSAVYVLTIAEGFEKLEQIRSIAAIKYRNGDLSEAVFRHIMDTHPTYTPPTLYSED